MTSIRMRRHEITLLPESARVIIRPFVPVDPERIAAIIGRALARTEEEAVQEMQAVHQEFDSRHFDIESLLLEHYAKVQRHIDASRTLSRARQLLIGAMFSGEYALESVALFNPAIVPHPDQSDVPDGGLRFIMSLRATGEGHISSIEFRVGTILPDGDISLAPVSRFVTMPEVVPNPRYRKKNFIVKLYEMGFDNDHTWAVTGPLAEQFTRCSPVRTTKTSLSCSLTTDTFGAIRRFSFDRKRRGNP